VPAQFLDEFARELSKIGERAFRRRYGAPVLIVSGRTAPAGKRKAAPATDTARERPDAVRALMSRVFPLIKLTGGAGPVVVGRAQATGVDVAIADPSISKRHCLFAPDEGAMNVTDCASTNGTAVNGAPVRGDAAVRLCGGEVVTLGRLELTFETPAGFAVLVSGLEGAQA
jgi:hypothetical protein